jgi:hypothetical protein
VRIILKKVRKKSDSVDSTDAVEDRDNWRAVVNTMTKRFVPYGVERLKKAENC